ncbi:MAG: hypothetical protein LQ339_000737 [Xanthoria mediterranea]|nr:MAG: hypothetical protein LQ339_000737 [Xanthoria mediterranea]
MPSSICWKCLSTTLTQPLRHGSIKPRIPIYLPTLAFSTTPSFQLPLPAKKSSGVKVTPKKGTKSLVIKKGKMQAENRARRPAPGERKALRKRIVLSNVNALEVQGMQNIEVENMYDRRVEGQVLRLPGPIVDQLRAVEAFKPTQSWGLFQSPGTLMRRESVDMGKLIADMSGEEGGSRRTVKRVLVGEKGSGKSMMLLQAMTMAFLKGWTVINLPEAQDITMGHTSYQPLPSSSPPSYIQPAYLTNLLRNLPTANPHLERLQFTQPTSSDLPIPIPPNISLARLASLGASDPEIAYPIFNLLVTELLSPGRPPVFLGLDGLAHAMQPGTGYTAPNLKPIHSYDLMILQWYFKFLGGQRRLPNGGIVMAATSQSNAPKVPSLDLALSELEGSVVTRAGQTVPKKERNPFMRYDERVMETLKLGRGIQVQRLQGLNKEEARGLMEYWAKSGMVRERVSEGLVAEKWAVSGGGVVGELERAVIRMRV